MDKEKNRKMWLAKIAEFKQSTLSQREWCRQNNLKLSTFKYWLCRSEYNPSDKKEEFEFARVSISKEASPAIAVEINGITLSVNDNYDELLLIKLIKTLKKL